MRNLYLSLAMISVLFVVPAAVADDGKTNLTLAELKDLHLYMDTASGVTGKLPDKETTVAALKMEKGAANTVKAIEDGSLVLTGAASRDDVWAYEKDAPVSGGYVLTSNGVDKLDAEAAKKRIGNK
jgi:hypothetical protein